MNYSADAADNDYELKYDFDDEENATEYTLEEEQLIPKMDSSSYGNGPKERSSCKLNFD